MSVFAVNNLVVFFLGILLFAIVIRRRQDGPLPPGPKPLPLIGNLLDMPRSTDRPWETFYEWGRRWAIGDIVSISLLGKNLVILNSYQVTMDLLEKRSSIYSNRPHLISAEAIGYTKLTPLMPYGERFKEQRRLLAQTIGTRSLVEKFMPLQEYEVQDFLLRLLATPDDFVAHIKRVVGSVIFLVSHGYQVPEKGDDRFLSLIDKGTDEFASALLPGAFMVDYFPALRYMPSWIPGGSWRRRVAEYRETVEALGKEPLSFTKQQMTNGTALPSFVSRNLEVGPSSVEHETQVMWTSVGLVAGGADTTTSTLHSYFLAMTLYPEVQKKAQAEIDAVVGRDRLPTFADRNQLPYVNALCSELLRWLPVVPLDNPHSLTEDDSYNGYFFPKDTIFSANIWGMLHNPDTYADPMAFMPERFLPVPDKTAELDPRAIAFGFGRRICPGIHIAETMIYITIANVLAVFDVSKAVENGVTITPPFAQTSGNLSHPMPFKCSIKPRSTGAESLIRAVNEDRHLPSVAL